MLPLLALALELLLALGLEPPHWLVEEWRRCLGLSLPRRAVTSFYLQLPQHWALGLHCRH
jgi:hypothetical protein